MIRELALEMLPAEATQKLRAYRRRNAFRDAGVVMIHVPRTAGTSLANVLYGRFIGHFTLQNFIDVSSPDILNLPRFAVVRNPWSRVVSAWSKVLTAGNLSLSRQKAKMPNVLASPPMPTDFDRFIKGWLIKQRVEKLNWVFQPQANFVTDLNGSIALNHVGRYESLDETESWLSDLLNRRIKTPHLNSGLGGYYRRFYTSDLRDAVADLYARDIGLFGYDF